ncbi:hypothetical protein HDU91_004828, partial [Kappamyces sp. JEL0680]
ESVSDASIGHESLSAEAVAESVASDETASEFELPVETYEPVSKKRKGKRPDGTDDWGSSLLLPQNKQTPSSLADMHSDPHQAAGASAVQDLDDLDDVQLPQPPGDSDEDEDSQFYNEVLENKKRKKAERAALYEQIHAPLAAKDTADENLGPDVKRRASYRILANRGLTPYRKKENRNPRVKRRMKYDKALKKLSSVRSVAVDKSKISSRYQGERTGIKANLARSTKF